MGENTVCDILGTVDPPQESNKIHDEDFRLHSLELPENQVNDPASLINVGFRHISYSVYDGILFSRTKRKLLDDITGNFPGGQLTAIMGPSGAGKTCLMNILSGYATTGILGEVLVNDEPRNNVAFRKQSCYIMQNDDLQPLLTVLESMRVAADLMLTASKTDKDKKIASILKSVTLWEIKHTRTDALSGGQKKRLSVALELLRDPQVMFFDEPTSGLDSLNSIRLVKLLKEMSESGKTIICTIHQPSATIFKLFDHLYVVSSGKCIYQGSPNNLLPYFEDFDLICPTQHNPADFLLEVASGDYGDFTHALSTKSNNGINESYAKLSASTMKLNSIKEPNIGEDFLAATKRTIVNEIEYTWDECGLNSYPTSTINQFVVLTKRSFLMLSRDRTLTYFRLGTHSAIALFLGILYFGVGLDAANINDNFSFMFFTVMFLMMTAFNCVVTTFPSELPIIIKEHFNKWYAIRSYYAAVSISDITVQNGVVIGPFFLLPFIMFSGYFVQLRDCPHQLKWMFDISFPRYALEGLVLTIFGYDRGKLPCESKDFCLYVYPEQFIKDKDMENASYTIGVMCLMGLIVGMRIAGGAALSIRLRHDRRRR
ncbi:ATP-binding cassette sub-family G member 1 isoform X2 [Diabrotica virgifera virgifera]|uniref:ATP-binding cassette sub-family G member 1-like isoform X2 n=1 Tax=Diabrotica virgifera virgifera TaxID=50390 RepID=A0A6P7G344_DIAVI|nr:ATP-binding cassette sub-family G member 1 isoform X2 [Diabrotica virgifera virgifera]KAI2474101.1 ATP binding cassette (ABC) protein subfamily G member [Diabrotica virgifera virgifera]